MYVYMFILLSSTLFAYCIDRKWIAIEKKERARFTDKKCLLFLLCFQSISCMYLFKKYLTATVV